MTSRGLMPAAGLALLMLLGGCGGPEGPASGLEIIDVQLMAGGDLARLNYRVVDIAKAKRTLGGSTPVRLMAEGGGALDVTSAGRVGPLRQRPSATGKRQFILFNNSARALKPGSRAVLIVGGSRFEGIPVS